MRLILARHGNTFEANETAVWVGARTDLALTAEGRAQAAAVGAGLRDAGLVPDRAMTGPLARTRETTLIALAAAGFDPPVTIDERLREIDYGLWEGRSNAEIAAAHGAAPLDAWSKHGVWPEGMGWRPSRAALVAGLAALLAELSGARAALLVSSNGVLKHLPEALGLDAPGDLKVRTGHLCLIETAPGPRVVAWNVPPAALSLG